MKIKVGKHKQAGSEPVSRDIAEDTIDLTQAATTRFHWSKLCED